MPIFYRNIFDISDSGRETLLDELRAEGDSSPLPSGVWSSGASTTPDDFPVQPSRLSLTPSPVPLPRGLPSTIIPSLPLNTIKQPRAVPHRTFKVILAGDAAVGKTSFIERVCNGHFATHLSSTIGNRSYNLNLELHYMNFKDHELLK